MGDKVGKVNEKALTKRVIQVGPGVTSTITRSKLTKAEYEGQRSTLHIVRDRSTKFGSKKLSPNTLAFSSVLRRRNVNSERESLSSLTTVNPNSTEQGHKSHFVPDVLGGPSIPGNLSFETQKTNLSVHKIVENDISREIDPDKEKSSPLKRRGSIVGTADFDANQNSTKRHYYVHADKGPGGDHTYTKISISTTRKG